VFLDAIPISGVRLEADVMTPHYAGWTPEALPGDWREPVPVPFLVVASRSAFVFSLLPRGVERSELENVFHWLREALRFSGAGAKTAVGYGRFAYDEPRRNARPTAHQ
jgi:CRISPR-associated protein Cmr6